MDKLILKKHKIYLILLLIVVTLTGCSSGNSSSSTPPPTTSNSNYIVNGTITERNLNTPINGATISMGSYTTITDSNGLYQLTNIESGPYTISVIADNYYSFQDNIEVYTNYSWDKALYPFEDGGLLTGQVKIINSIKDYSDQVFISKNSSDSNFSTANIPEYKENEILVKYRSDYEPITIQNNNNLVKLGSSKSLRNKGIIVNYKIPDDKNIDDVLNEYKSLSEVEWAEPNYIYHITSIPNDPYYSQQWGNHKTNLEGARDYFTGNNSVTVAVLDTGIIPHPDLEGRILTGADFVDEDDNPTDETNSNSHGTHVAGIIAANTDNNKGIAGVYGQVDILPIRVLTDHYGDTADLIDGIKYAIEKDVDIINMSLAGSGSSTLLRETIKEAVDQGIVVIAAAGNSSGWVQYPAAFPEVIAVGAISQDNELSYFSNYGSELELLAPGEEIISTSGNKTNYYKYVYMSGTSMAAPYVSGIAALLKANKPNMTGTEIRNMLNNTALDLGEEGQDIFYGYGLVDAYAALRGEALPLPNVFVATVSGNDVSTVTPPGDWDNGSFFIPGVPEGDYYLVAVRDLNNNNTIDTGDYFGKSTETINIEEHTTTSKDITLYYVDDTSPYYGYNLH